jgi:hypothetical protein
MLKVPAHICLKCGVLPITIGGVEVPEDGQFKSRWAHFMVANHSGRMVGLGNVHRLVCLTWNFDSKLHLVASNSSTSATLRPKDMQSWPQWLSMNDWSFGDSGECQVIKRSVRLEVSSIWLWRLTMRIIAWVDCSQLIAQNCWSMDRMYYNINLK